MDNILFLDFDGVMMPDRMWAMNSLYTGSSKLVTFDPVAVHQLNKIYEDLENNLNLVITSTWQADLTYDEMVAFLESQELIIPLADNWNTKDDGSKTRKYFIKDYIETNKISNYAVLDDINMTDYFGDRMILTEYNDGLLTSHFNQLRKIFGISKSLIMI